MADPVEWRIEKARHEPLIAVLLLTEGQPADAGVNEAELVAGGVDALDKREAEVPFEGRIDEWGDEPAARLRFDGVVRRGRKGRSIKRSSKHAPRPRAWAHPSRSSG